MGDNHTVYERPEGQTTQWEDIQRKMGNLPPAPKVWKPEAWSAKEERPRGAVALVVGDDADAVDDLEGEFDDDRFLEEYRLKRLAELRERESRSKEASRAGKRGVVTTISKDEYVSKITRASAGFVDDGGSAAGKTSTTTGRDYDDRRREEEDDEEEEDLKAATRPSGPPRWVVCHMFREGVTACDDVDEALRQLADSLAAAAAPSTSASASASASSSSSSRSPPPPPRVSFVRIRADEVAPGYPLSALPTLLVYFGGECVASLKGKDALVVGRGTTTSAKKEDDDGGDDKRRTPYSATSRGSSSGRVSTAMVLDALEASAPGIMLGGSKKKNRKNDESDSGGSDSE